MKNGRAPLNSLLLLLLTAASLALAQPTGGGSQAGQWAKEVASQLHSAAIGIVLAGVFGSVLVLAVAHLVPSMMMRQLLVRIGEEAIIGAVITLMVVFSMKILLVTIASFISPEVASQLAAALQEVGA